ncbi:MAG TPA: alpha/beta hydrolase [Solirubrobacteraceae bacterium]|nr:alpha/beta hydrolase [Solirubrobacteraceae bacterium]
MWIALAALLALALAAPTANAAHAERTLRVGSLTLHRCGTHRGSDHGPGWCTKVKRALDPSRPNGPKIGIQTQWIPAAEGHASGTIVANEGGPGYPSTGSYDEYIGIFKPLLRTHNLVLIDNRGTGGSGILRCPRLQNFTGRTSGPAFAKLVGACGRSLNHKFKLPDGKWLHASDLYGTAYAVADMAAILRKLHTGRVTMYGDSYGSWLTQAFISRHPRMVKAVILDSTYYLRGLSPWYASSGVEGRRAIRRVCKRNIACDIHDGAGAVTRLAKLVHQVRHRPISGTTRLATGKRVHVTITARQLVDLIQDSGSDPVILREEDASVRAALAGDDAPLLRLVAQEQSYNHGTSTAVYFNDALYMAVSCTDYPQLFDMHARPRVRAKQFARAVARRSSTPFAPFTTAEWVSMSGYSQPYDVCLDWPSPVHHAPVEPRKRTVLPKSVPILAIGGDVDDLTPLSDVRKFAPTLGRNVRVVDLRNTVHATTEGDTFLSAGAACGRSIIDRFAAHPTRLQRMNVSCAAKIPPIHTPGSYPLTLAGAPRATVVSGHAGNVARRAAWVAAQTAADATIRYYYTYVNGPGLRGGGFAVKALKSGAYRFALHRDRFVGDAFATGTFTWDPANNAIRGTVVVHTGGRRYSVAIAWSQRDTYARATVAGATLRLPTPGP